jgi:hypothetical protein
LLTQEQNICMKSSDKPLWLSNWILDEELGQLGIPLPYRQAITAPLPKELKFLDPYFLKKRYSEKALFHLYRNAPVAKGAAVIIFTWVIGDGLGDFSAQIETAKALLEVFSSIYLVTLHPSSMTLSPPSLPCPHFFIPYVEPLSSAWNAVLPVSFSSELLSLFQSADLILQIPTYYPHTNSLLSGSHAVYELIGEGGWGHTPQYSPKLSSRSLGLHSWEVGLFFPPIQKKPDLQDNLFDPLLQAIFRANKKNRSIYFAYMRTRPSCKLFLQTILIKTMWETKDLFLCAFPTEFFIQELSFLKEELQRANICQVKIFYESHTSTIDIQSRGKTLTILQTKKMSRADYQTLLQLSCSPIGCRGDGSLSELASLGAIPFFDFPAHKRPLLEGLTASVHYHFGEKSIAYQYLLEFLQKDPDPHKLGSFLQNPLLSTEFKQISSCLLENYNAKAFIQNLAIRATCHHMHPEIAFMEKILLQPFLSGEKRAFDALQEIQSYLRHSNCVEGREKQIQL